MDSINYPDWWENLDLKWKLLSLMAFNRASDMYSVAQYEVWLKICWKISPITRLWILSNDDVKAFLDLIFTPKQKSAFESELEIDFAYEWEAWDGQKHRFRINAFHQSKKVSACLRYLPPTNKSIDELWLPPLIKELASLNSGIILVCWVTWSWKSTTIAAMIDYINATKSKHIISIEDPVEYTFDKKMSWIEQREVWTDTVSFSRAMKSALRQNPNVLFLWEMRDLESIASAITIAESGHLVLSTIHARNSVQCINKIIDSFPSGQQNQVRLQLSEALAAILTQKLIPSAYWTTQELAMEIMVNNSATANLIRENHTYQIESIIQTSSSEWMILLDSHIISLFRQWKITMESAITYSNDPERMTRSLQSMLWQGN